MFFCITTGKSVVTTAMRTRGPKRGVMSKPRRPILPENAHPRLNFPAAFGSRLQNDRHLF